MEQLAACSVLYGRDLKNYPILYHSKAFVVSSSFCVVSPQNSIVTHLLVQLPALCIMLIGSMVLVLVPLSGYNPCQKCSSSSGNFREPLPDRESVTSGRVWRQGECDVRESVTSGRMWRQGESDVRESVTSGKVWRHSPLICSRTMTTLHSIQGDNAGLQWLL